MAILKKYKILAHDSAEQRRRKKTTSRILALRLKTKASSQVTEENMEIDTSVEKFCALSSTNENKIVFEKDNSDDLMAEHTETKRKQKISCTLCRGDHRKRECSLWDSTRVKKPLNGKKYPRHYISSGQKSSARPAGDLKIRRSKGIESYYTGGIYDVVKIPRIIKDTITEEQFAEICENAAIVKEGMAIGQLSRGCWLLKYATPEDAMGVVGECLLFPKELGLRKDLHVEILPYHPGGPKAFYTDRVGPYEDLDLQKMVEIKFPREKFWMGKKMIGSITAGKRLLLFEESQPFNFFEIGKEEGFVVRFRPAECVKKCSLCDSQHEGGMITCPTLSPCFNSAELSNRLLFRPE